MAVAITASPAHAAKVTAGNVMLSISAAAMEGAATVAVFCHQIMDTQDLAYLPQMREKPPRNPRLRRSKPAQRDGYAIAHPAAQKAIRKNY